MDDESEAFEMIEQSKDYNYIPKFWRLEPMLGSPESGIVMEDLTIRLDSSSPVADEIESTLDSVWAAFLTPSMN